MDMRRWLADEAHDLDVARGLDEIAERTRASHADDPLTRFPVADPMEEDRRS